MRKGDQRDIDMIEHPSRWPNTNLAMKKYRRDGDMPECALISSAHPLSVWAYPDQGGKLIKTYSTIQELINDGWMVD